MNVININALDAFNLLSQKDNSHLIDTRSDLEWETTGIPDLTTINKDTHLYKWGPVLDQRFFEQYKNFLLARFNQEDILFFICRSGSRSLMAAKFAVKFGFENSYNIYDGFSDKNNQSWKNILPIKFL